MGGSLQWGHAEFGVENFVFAIVFNTPSRASMGPRRIRRGEPRPPLGWMPSSAALQWGHAEFGVENGPLLPTGGAAHELQWGHAEFGVENRKPCGQSGWLKGLLQWGHAEFG